MRLLLLTITASVLTSCGPSWPEDQFPNGLRVKRTLFAREQFGGREGCDAMVVELVNTGEAAGTTYRRTDGSIVSSPPPSGWSLTPKPSSKGAHSTYESAFNGCNDEGDTPPGDLDGALSRPGSYYKVLSGGEGIAIIEPKAKLAGYFYAG